MLLAAYNLVRFDHVSQLLNFCVLVATKCRCCSQVDDAEFNLLAVEWDETTVLPSLGKKFKGPIKLQECKILSFRWIRETVHIEVFIVRPNFYVNISEQFTIRECMRPSFEGSINMDLYEDVDEDDYLRKKSHVVRLGRKS